jgi:large subunit ribosomal protein L4
MAQTTKATKATTSKVVKTVKSDVALEAKVYDAEGKSAGTVSLPADIFGLNWNADLIHQVVTSMMTDARQPLAHTKTRGEVSGTGKKPWKQKGTGRARHGSRRSPIWVGGGVAHGPRNDKNFDRKVNKKMKTKAVFTLLSKKFRDGEVIFVKGLDLAEPKANNAKSFLTRVALGSGQEMLAKKRKNAAVITTPELSLNAKRGFQNFSNLEVMETRNLNPLALVNYKYVVIASPEASLVTLAARSAK